jgi:hypothetical protein
MLVSRRCLLLATPALVLPYRRALALTPAQNLLLNSGPRQVTIPLVGSIPAGWTFARASTATYMNRGVLYTALANVPRFETDANGVPLGYWNGPAATNPVLYSRDLTNVSNWFPGNLTAAKNATGVDGAANAASTLTIGTTAGLIYEIQTVSQSTDYTFSFWAKAGNATGPQYAVYDVTNSVFLVASTTYAPGAGAFSRISVPFTTAGTTTSVRIYPVRNVAGTGTVIIDGAQLDTGTFATSTIFTAGTAVTRNADNLSVPLSLYPWWASSRGFSGAIRFTSGGAAQSSVNVLDITDGTSSNRITLALQSANKAVVSYYVAGSGVASSSYTLNAVGAGNSFALSSSNLGLSFSLNGASVITLSKPGMWVPTLMGLGRSSIFASGYAAMHALSLTLRAGPSSTAWLQNGNY